MILFTILIVFFKVLFTKIIKIKRKNNLFDKYLRFDLVYLQLIHLLCSFLQANVAKCV